MVKLLFSVADFYKEIADMLVEGAVKTADKAGVSYEVIKVPGAFELPGVINMARATGNYDGYVALGCVIRGETTHYDIVCNESARGLTDLILRYNIAVGLGILTVENKQQALVRADVKAKDKGGFATQACLRMIEIQKQFGVR